MKKIPKLSRKKPSENESSKDLAVVSNKDNASSFELEKPKRRLVPSAKYSHRELTGKITHHILSVALPIAIYILVAVFHLPWIALSLVILSKWQIFVVKPRFWWANIKFSAVDLIFKLSVLALVYLAQLKIDPLINRSPLVLEIFQLAVISLYLFWNIHLRKQTSPKGMRLQALLAQGLSLTAICWVGGFAGPTLPLSLTIIASWIVSYAAAQHILYAYEESAIPQLASFWALFSSSLIFLQLIWAQNFIFFSGLLYLPLMPAAVSGFALLAALAHEFIEEKQSAEDFSRAQIEKERQKLIKQVSISVGISAVLALLIMFR
jgi:hypothetical protein